jgi:autoinducer 2-degrading protein
MLIVHVFVRVLPDKVEDFKQATIDNARSSIKEAGVARFDVLQQKDDPSRFVLSEAYMSEEATHAHKGTPHYRIWRDAVAGMMAESRTSTQYVNVFPDARDW